MNGLMSSTPSPTAIRLAVGGLLFGQVQALILLWGPGLVVGSPRSLVVVLTLLSFASLVAAIVGDSGDDPKDRWRRRRGA